MAGTSAALRNHKYKKHREMAENAKQEGISNANSSRLCLNILLIAGKFKCGFCGKGSQSKKGRENHKYKYHKVIFNHETFPKLNL